MIDKQSRHPLCWGARQAQAEGLTLRKSDNMSGYANVSMPQRTNPLKPYQALVTRGGKNGKKKVLLGSFATAGHQPVCRSGCLPAMAKAGIVVQRRAE